MANPIKAFVDGFSGENSSKDITIEGASSTTSSFGLDSDFENTSYNDLVTLAIKNGLSRRAIDFIASNIANIPLKVVEVNSDGEESDVGNHPILDLLKSPGGPNNNRYTKSWLFQGMVWSMMGGGEFWLRSVSPDNSVSSDNPKKLGLFDKSDFSHFKVDDMGFIDGYVLQKEFPYTRKTVEGDTEEILHSFNYNPRNKFRGLPILLSVVRSLSLIEDFDNWNKNISKNRGQIPGFFMPVGLEDGEQLDQDVRNQAQDQVDKQVNNSRKGHKWLVLGGAFEPEDNNITPKDVSYLEGIKHKLRMVATGLGIDPVLLGDDSAQTYNNFQTAKIVAFTTRIVPMMEFFLSSLNRWLVPKFEESGQTLRLTFDPMQIDALREAMLQKIDTLTNATGTPILTADEARSILGREPVGADSLVLKLNMQTHDDLFRNGMDLDSQRSFDLKNWTDDEIMEKVNRIINNDVKVDPRKNGSYT
jgi:HK97 family phage portal protein